jgi:solute carrier family 25 citrate transporter 1
LESSFKYKSSIDCFIKTLKNEGMLGLYKGTIPRLTRVVADVAITFTIFDKINLLINYYFPDK